MADAVEERRSLVRCALDPPLHFDEGVSGASDLAGASRTKLVVAPLAETLSGVGERKNWANLIAQKEDRERNQDGRGE